MRKKSMALRAYSELRRRILTMQMIPNVRIKEDAWASVLGVSRIAIREALTRLLGERLVLPGPRGGYFVTSLQSQDVKQIRELRQILELGAVKLTCSNITKEQITKLENVCDVFTAMIDQHFLAGANEADLKFHELLVEYSGNKKLLRSYISSHIPLFHEHLTKAEYVNQDLTLTDKEHRAILKAIRDKNPIIAKRLLNAHFVREERVLQS